MDDVMVDVAELVGRFEIAMLAGVSLQTVDTWRRRYATFPAPLLELSGSPIWRWPDVEAWMHNTPRLVGRPSAADRPRTPVRAVPDRLGHVIRRTDPDPSGSGSSSTA